jgi:hypothetical protein
MFYEIVRNVIYVVLLNMEVLVVGDQICFYNGGNNQNGCGCGPIAISNIVNTQIDNIGEQTNLGCNTQSNLELDGPININIFKKTFSLSDSLFKVTLPSCVQNLVVMVMMDVRILLQCNELNYLCPYEATSVTDEGIQIVTTAAMCDHQIGVDFKYSAQGDDGSVSSFEDQGYLTGCGDVDNSKAFLCTSTNPSGCTQSRIIPHEIVRPWSVNRIYNFSSGDEVNINIIASDNGNQKQYHFSYSVCYNVIGAGWETC